MSEEARVTKRENNVIIRKEKELPNSRIFTEFNKMFICGEIENEFEYSHEMYWEKFYRTRIKVRRLSGIEDFIPIVVSGVLLGKEMMNKSFKGKFVEAAGQFRSYNRRDETGRSHLELFLFVLSINIYEDEEEMEELSSTNLLYLRGYLCKPPVFRETPLGREITDLLIAVNRRYGKADYIPCIAWGRNAKWVSKLDVGNQIELYGRVQSREYFKRVSKGSEVGEYKQAYEVSIMKVQKLWNLELEG